MDGDPDIPAQPPSLARLRLDHLVDRAGWTLVWERAWPSLWWPLAVLIAFLVASWLGLWLGLSVGWRQIGTAVFGLALLGSFWPLLRIRRPGRSAALDRIDRDSSGSHRAARALDDTLALGGQDAGSRVLWALHLGRAERAVRAMRLAPPRPDMPRRDRYALRAAGVVAAVAAAFVAGPEIGDRLGAAFDWRGPAEAAPLFRIDGWIDPPLYTRLPPLMMDFAASEQSLKAPVGSTVVIRVAGRGDATMTPGAGLAELEAGVPARPDLRERRFKLTGSTDLDIRTGLTGQKQVRLEAIPDHPPEIALAAPPESNAQGGLSLSYTAKDDYGIASAEGVIERPDGPAGRRSLVDPPHIALTLPADPHAGEETKTTADLSEHGWAGARVKLTLVARDEAGQEGRSRSVAFTLPQRPFTNPLARALVEQRRDLILDPDHHDKVQLALDALLIAPEQFTPEWGIFLGLKVAAQRLQAARTDPDLTSVAEWLWAMALQIENGDLSDAERQMRAAQERLSAAIDSGADEKEIKRLAEQLRQAMDRYLKEFAERQKNTPQDSQQNSRMPDRVITQNDLNRMLNEMQDAMKRGDVAEAQRLLDQLKNILDNLRTAQKGNRMSDPLAREMNRQMQDLDEMAREQQKLRDDTYRKGENRQTRRRGDRRDGAQPRSGSRQPNGHGMRQQPGQNGEGDDEEAQEGQDGQNGLGLGQRQQALRERLQEMQRRMRGLGMQGEKGLSEAENAMREAEGQLGQGRNGPAVDSQGRALEGLQRGMQGMAQQMQQMMGQNDGSGEDGDPYGPGNPQGRAQNDARSDDPLGRPTRSRDFSDGRVKIPGADESAVARARRILEELRRKLGDPSRPREELDYFERLLRRQ